MTTRYASPDLTLRTIGQRVLMALGARNIRHTDTAVIFDASILPMTARGRGTAARTMRVQVTLNPADLYDVLVAYPRRGDRYAAPIIHFEATGIYGDSLSALMLALDYDGREILNPRLAGQ